MTPSTNLRCPKGSYPNFVHNSYTYNTPLAKFTNITKSFFDIAWYGSASKMTGTDNVPGATCGGNSTGSWYTDTLAAYLAHPDVLEYTIHGDPFFF
ncbi:hypothetical protein DFH09DRAFT_1313131 [Mycena vulgaris]|nr:hypothetical protein DFH09DRAFT_1313131 [Mycena vulgaris]